MLSVLCTAHQVETKLKNKCRHIACIAASVVDQLTFRFINSVNSVLFENLYNNYLFNITKARL